MRWYILCGSLGQEAKASLDSLLLAGTERRKRGRRKRGKRKRGRRDGWRGEVERAKLTLSAEEAIRRALWPPDGGSEVWGKLPSGCTKVFGDSDMSVSDSTEPSKEKC